jgi:hypothetical protein
VLNCYLAVNAALSLKTPPLTSISFLAVPLNGWMDDMEGRMDGWMDGWMDKIIIICGD